MKKLQYLEHLDSLRALAVILVIFFHLDITVFKGGFIGVDVFFVISGFLITRIIKHEYETTNNFDFKKFYVRRARRLIPSLFLVLILTFIFSFLIFSPSDFINSTKSIFMGSIALNNFYFLNQSGYFETASHFKPLLHTWSLAIEEQFYLIWPATIYFLFKIFSTKKAVIFVALIFLLSLFITIYTSTVGVSTSILNVFSTNNELYPDLSSFQFFLLPFRIFEFLVGALLVFLPLVRIKSEIFKLSLNILGILLIVLSALFFEKSHVYLSSLNLIPCLGIGLLIIIPPSKFLSFFFNNKYAISIGKASYTWYLIHWPVIVFYKYLITSELGVLEQVSLLILSLMISLLIYKYYETPLRHNVSKISFKANSSFANLILIFIVFFFLIKTDVNVNDGWLWRLEKKNIDLIESIGDTKNFHQNNWGGVGYSGSGWIENNVLTNVDANPTKKTDMFWFGDSHTGHFSYGLDSVMVKKHNKKIHMTNFSALLLPEVRPTHLDFNRVKNKLSNEIKLLKENPKATFVLSHLWRGQMIRSETVNEETNEYELISDDIPGLKIVADKIVNMIDIIGGNNRKVFIMGQGPSSGTNSLNYIEKLMRPKYFSMLSPTTSIFEKDENSIKVNEFFEDYFSKYDNINFIDPSTVLCENNLCLSQEGNEIYFSDSTHLSKDGSLHVIQYLENMFLK